MSNLFPIEQYRRFYAEEIRAVAGGCSPALVEAFAHVERERFLGSAPWKYPVGSPVRPGGYRSTQDPRDLYHDIVVVLKPEQHLNAAQPSQMARMITALDLRPGQRVLHVGCGTGYYSALMAEVVGPSGSVLAIEVDQELAERAVRNLDDRINVTVQCGDGAQATPAELDAVLINAGITHPHPDWLAALAAAGVFVAPFLVGSQPGMRDALVLRLARTGSGFAAEAVTALAIYPCTSQRDPAVQAQLRAAIASHSMLALRSATTQPHERKDTCLVHTPGFCLSTDTILQS